MPQIQMIDSTPRKQEPTGVQEFFSKLASSYKEKQDEDTIGNILAEYGQNMEDARAYQTALNRLQRAPISPIRKAQEIKTLQDQERVLIERDKALNARFKHQQELRDVELGEQTLKNAGASQQQIDLYKAAPTGGKTEVIKNVLEDIQRNQSPEGTVSPELEDFDKGLTAKERVKRQDARYTAQSPILLKNSEAIHGLENENMSLGLLNELDQTGKIGQNFHKLNINPKTGELVIPQLGTPEEQLFVKTVNDFTVKAKESFGARVTNFELDRFMQRLPTLANSPEGRKLIIRQMQIVNKINSLEKYAIQEVFDRYGVRNIDYADAEKMARKKIESEKESLRKEYFDIEQVAKKEDAENIEKIRKNVPEGFTAMRKPDGSIKQFPTKNVSALEEKGYKKI